MQQPMPVGDFRWLSPDELAKFDVLRDVKEEDDSGIGFIVECDLEYPEMFHSDHNSIPLAAHKQRITERMLSPYAMAALETARGKVGTSYKADKLTSSFERREKYVCHGVNLKLYLELGMRLLAVHRVIRFKQEPFIRPYIDFCAKMRAESKTKSRSNTFKMCSNAVFGKMIENANNRMDTMFVEDRKTALRKNTDPRLKGQMVLEENLTIAFLSKKEVKLNQLWPVGFSILELSKAHMLRMYYKKIRPTFHGKSSILLSDTDSYVLALGCPSVDSAITMLKDVMDTSNYPKTHSLYDESRKNVPGLLKNEMPTQDIVECVAVRSKVYALRTEKSFDSRCKGVKKTARKAIPFEDFRDTVLSPTPKTVVVTQYSIQSKNHVNRLMKLTKTAMTSFDDKRFLSVCGVHSFPYGSRLIRVSAENDACFYCSNPHLYA